MKTLGVDANFLGEDVKTLKEDAIILNAIVNFLFDVVKTLKVDANFLNEDAKILIAIMNFLLIKGRTLIAIRIYLFLELFKLQAADLFILWACCSVNGLNVFFNF